jgi:hypothetical protein
LRLDVIWVFYRSQDDDALDALLKPYRMTGANLTTFRMVLNRFPPNAPAAGEAEMMRSLTSHRPNGDYATVHDTLLSLYHGVLIQSQDGSAGSCHWAGKERLLNTLIKVGPLNFTLYLPLCLLVSVLLRLCHLVTTFEITDSQMLTAKSISWCCWYRVHSRAILTLTRYLHGRSCLCLRPSATGKSLLVILGILLSHYNTASLSHQQRQPPHTECYR